MFYNLYPHKCLQIKLYLSPVIVFVQANLHLPSQSRLLIDRINNKHRIKVETETVHQKQDMEQNRIGCRIVLAGPEV